MCRAHLPWLLAAAHPSPVPPPPKGSLTAEVVGLLTCQGACFAHELTAATARPMDEISRALWDGVARGVIMSGGFEAIRHRVVRQPSLRSRRWSVGARLASMAPTAGRWSARPPPAEGLDGHDLAEAAAEQLLQRWGVFRALAARDGLHLPWRELQWACRRLEDRGLVRGGRWVARFSGEHYALPEAAEHLDRIRRTSPPGETVTVNATDPTNLVGLLLPGTAVPAIRTNHITYIDGIPTV